jgi:hypothetical protein
MDQMTQEAREQEGDPHAGHQMSKAHGNHDRHAGHSVAMFRDSSMFPWMRMMPNQPEFQYDIRPFFVFAAFGAFVGAAVPLYFLITRRFAFENGTSD